MPLRTLVIDDDADTCRLTAARLAERGFDVCGVLSGPEGLAVLADGDIDIIVTDIAMDGMDGLTLCNRALTEHPDIPVVVMTASRDIETAIGAIRAGASDFVTKPIDGALLESILVRVAGERRRVLEIERLRQAAPRAPSVDGLIGRSVPMRNLHALVSRVAESESSILVSGESGTGKEVVARAIHQRSGRCKGPFVAVNCAAIPDALLESELFGHRRGAFTDAQKDHDGLFIQAHGGTLLLDEVGELPLALQPKLLRAIQSRSVRPLGGDREVAFDARFVVATNRDLRADVAAGRFRADLFYRLAVIHLEVPPLRVRGDDVLLLAQHFLERFAVQSRRPVTGFMPSAAERLIAYGWPGNVRELENCIERAVALARHQRLGTEDLPAAVRSAVRAPVAANTETPLVSLAEVERQHVHAVLQAVGHNASHAARILGIDRKTLSRKFGSTPARRRRARATRPGQL